MHSIYQESPISIFTGYKVVTGQLTIPVNVISFVIIANENSSSRISRRNKMISNYFAKKSIGTFVLDLLSPDEEKRYFKCPNIPLLAERLRNVTIELLDHPSCKNLLFGYFGSDAVAAAALMAASDLPEIKSIVSWRGRPDLVIKYLPFIYAPTLFIVDSYDDDICKFNQQALYFLNCKKDFELLNDNSSFLKEKDTIEVVLVKATEWFNTHLHPLMINVN
jgi:putative phosphoribosyl transferase